MIKIIENYLCIIINNCNFDDNYTKNEFTRGFRQKI